MDRVKCFMIEETRQITQFVICCSNKHRTVIETVERSFEETKDDVIVWPSNCPQCGVSMVYDGKFEQGWNTRIGTRIWRQPETGEEHIGLEEFGAGAMFDASWLPWKGPDGLSLSVILPPGGQVDVWHIDGFAGGSDHRPWERTGTPPNVTAKPSILTPRYHGFLTNGYLESV